MDFVLNYLHNIITKILSSLGLIKKKVTIILLGLDNAGKTTFLHKLKTNTILTSPPTERPYISTFSFHGITFAGWDLGGHEAVRHLWEDYVIEASAVMFLIDATDVTRFQEVNLELDALLAQETLTENHVPIAIMLNKCDLQEAQSSECIAEAIDYQNIVEMYNSQCFQSKLAHDDIEDNSQDNLIQMFRMSVYRGEGYQDAFQWLAQYL
jgi:GTP-binding protein SAR1